MQPADMAIRPRSSILVLDEADRMLDMGFIARRSARIVGAAPEGAPDAAVLGHAFRARSRRWPNAYQRNPQLIEVGAPLQTRRDRRAARSSSARAHLEAGRCCTTC
jgi:superfamily II DNA/RNA helicase